MKDTDQINEDNFDDQLKEHLLNNGGDEAFADSVMQQDYDVKIDAGKEKEMLNRVNAKLKKGGSGWFPYIYSAVVVLIVGLLAVYFAATKSDGSKSRAQEAQKDSVLIAEALANSSAINRNLLNTENPDLKKDTFGKIERMFTLLAVDSIRSIPKESPQPVQKISSDLLPFVSVEDKTKYATIKQQMLARLYKLDKDLYTHIEADQLNYSGKDIVVDAFSIRNVAITNLEYKTFLADLIAQGRTEEYYKSEVLTLRWNSEGYPLLAADYYSREKYNDFPVVNVSAGAANIFSKWISDELQKYSVANKLKQRDFEIRLPYDKEWILAARNGYAKISYESGYNTLYELKEGLVDFTFVKRLNQIKKKSLLRDSVYEMYITNRYGWEEKAFTDFLAQAHNGFNYLPADTIYPERMKLYGKIGHVSEMVPQFNSSRIWLSGFTWKAKEDYEAFEGKFKTIGVSPFVGFRLVVIDKQDPVYKSPFW